MSLSTEQIEQIPEGIKIILDFCQNVPDHFTNTDMQPNEYVKTSSKKYF